MQTAVHAQLDLVLVNDAARQIEEINKGNAFFSN